MIRKDEVVPVGDPLLPNNRKEQRWLPKRFQTSKRLPKLPIAVLPGHFDKRIGTQRSTFTIHGADVDGLITAAKADKNAGLVKIVIPGWAVREIQRSLDTCGIDETTVFPNLEALSRVVEYRWKEQKRPLPHQRVCTRLKASKIHGVGVFAIKNIPKGTKLFVDDLDEMVWVEKDKLKSLPAESTKLYKDFSPLKGNRYGCPTNFNRLTMSWYVNHSDHPNVRCDNNYNFWTLEPIKEGRIDCGLPFLPIRPGTR